MNIPSAYAQWRSALGFDEVSYGVGGIRIAALAELEELQLGYSRSPDGLSSCGGEGEWQIKWIAIGYETCMGDPIILDVETMQVMTAPHGQGEWTPEPIAASLEGFGAALKEFRRLATGRENPVQLGANPLPANEREAGLLRISQANPDTEICFWELQLRAGNDENGV